MRKNIPEHYTNDEINALVERDELAVIIGPAVYTVCNEEKGSDDGRAGGLVGISRPSLRSGVHHHQCDDEHAVEAALRAWDRQQVGTE